MLKNIKKFCFMGIFCFMLFLLFPVTVAHAEPETGGNAAGEDGGAGQNKVIGGPYFEKSGWLVYIIDDSNHQVSETLVIYGSARKPDSSYTEYTKTKFGGKFDDYDSNLYVKWTPPYPYEKNGTANGPAIKSAMLQNDYVLDFITEYFGASMLQRFIDKELYLILEPFFWGQMYDGKNPTGIYLCATARGWADMQKKLGIDEYGSPRINRFTNNTYPNCVKLEYPQFGLEPLSGKLTNTQIMSSGNGFMAFWASEDVETPLPEEEEVVANRQLYAIKNWSDDFDISRGIPSGEEVRNTYEASSFFANSVIKTATSSPKQYSATYTYKELVTYSIPMIGPDGEEMTNPKTGENGSPYFVAISSSSFVVIMHPPKPQPFTSKNESLG